MKSWSNPLFFHIFWNRIMHIEILPVQNYRFFFPLENMLEDWKDSSSNVLLIRWTPCRTKTMTWHLKKTFVCLVSSLGMAGFRSVLVWNQPCSSFYDLQILCVQIVILVTTSQKGEFAAWSKLFIFSRRVPSQFSPYTHKKFHPLPSIQIHFHSCTMKTNAFFPSTASVAWLCSSYLT